MSGSIPSPASTLESDRPLLAVTIGDPAGIGPEVAVKALYAACVQQPFCRAIILGAQAPLMEAASNAGIPPFWTLSHERESHAAPVSLLTTPTAAPLSALIDWRHERKLSGELSYRWVLEAVHLCMHGPCHAMVTGPISKHAWHQAGHTQFPGHTELLAYACAAEHCGMFFHAPPTPEGPGLNVILATVHLPLSLVPSRLTRARVLDSIRLAHDTMRRLGVPAPRLAVCGLNPHAGEQGLLGREDHTVIEPAIKAAQRQGILAHGPLPADTVFQHALIHETSPTHRYDCVVAMYHDQGLAPLKTLAWDRAVNLTVGLPIIRTSPDHGTAFDIAGTNAANPGSMLAALRLAARLAAANGPIHPEAPVLPTSPLPPLADPSAGINVILP